MGVVTRGMGERGARGRARGRPPHGARRGGARVGRGLGKGEETRRGSRGRAWRALVARTLGRPRNAGRSSPRKGTSTTGAPAGAWVRPRKRPWMTCRCVSPPRVLSCPHLVEAYFSNILLTATTARPRPCPSRADLACSSRPPPRADAGPPARGGLRPPRRGLEAARVLRRHAHVRPRARSPRRTTRETRLALVVRETQRKTKTFYFRLRIRRSQSVDTSRSVERNPTFFFSDDANTTRRRKSLYQCRDVL